MSGEAGGTAETMTRELRRLRLSLELLLEKRARLVVGADLLLLVFGFVAAAVDGGAGAFYVMVVLAPAAMFGLPLLSDAVPLERRAGSLELVLASPTARTYFVRRIGSLTAVIAAQGVFAMLLFRFLGTQPFPLTPVFIQIVTTSALVATCVLFWSVRLASAGGILVGSAVSLLLACPWLLRLPFGSSTTPLDWAAWARANLVLATASVILFLYAWRRLGRTEPLL